MEQFEEQLHQDLHQFLQSMKEVDERLPECPDVEDKWEEIAKAYIPDGIREFNDFPSASLGWMMYIGMAVAKFWDAEWEIYSKIDNLYAYMRDKRGYDAMDEYIREDVLLLQGVDYTVLEKVAGECASRVYNALRHQNIEPGTKEAFNAYVSCLHQLYQMGAAMQLNRMGYYMKKNVITEKSEFMVKQFIQNFREAFGQKATLPLLFGYSNQPVADTERINGCFFKGLQAAREGAPVSLSAEVIACGGGKLYTGFTDMPERVPGFVSLKEKYKKTPQMVIDYVEDLGMKRAEQTYLNFVRIDKAESFDGFEGIMFYATPDMLSGLCGWAFFDTNAADAVVTRFGSGCSSVVSMTIVENARQGQRCFMGLLDPSVRPYVGTNELSFTIPMSRFKSMMETMKECFLFDSHAWKKVKARLEE